MSVSRHSTMMIAAMLAVALSWGARAQDAAPAVPAAPPSAAAPAAPVSTSPAATVPYRELIWGDAKAPLTVIEYASLTCPHCARFANDIFPEIKTKYIDTGKVRWVFRDYPTPPQQLAFAAAALARCAPEDRGKKMIETLFKNQENWAGSQQPLPILKQYAALAGLTSEDVDACWQNETLLKTMDDEIEKGATLYHVAATPTFFIGDEKVDGELKLPAFVAILDRHLAGAGKAKFAWRQEYTIGLVVLIVLGGGALLFFRRRKTTAT